MSISQAVFDYGDSLAYYAFSMYSENAELHYLFKSLSKHLNEYKSGDREIGNECVHCSQINYVASAGGVIENQYGSMGAVSV